MTPHQPISAKAKRRHDRKALRDSRALPGSPFGKPTEKPYVPLSPRNDNQALLIDALGRYPVIFATGPAGVGKTYVSARVAATRLLDPADPIEKIVLTRSTIAPKRHQMGFLPGRGDQKMAPWLIPVMEGLQAEVGSKAKLDALKQSGAIEIISMEHMRGRSLERCFVICDEAQNLLFPDFRMLLTRIGESSAMALCGDAEQSDLDDQESALDEVSEMPDLYDMDAITIVFTEDDVVRSAAAREWVKAFRRSDFSRADR